MIISLSKDVIRIPKTINDDNNNNQNTINN